VESLAAMISTQVIREGFEMWRPAFLMLAGCGECGDNVGMVQTIEINDLALEITAEEVRETRDYVRLSGQRVSIRLPRKPARYLRHGWHSWSLAAWTDLSPLPLQQPRILHAMQIDPAYVHETLPHGSWFGAVDFEEGNVLLLGALGLDTHVRLNADTLEGWSEAGKVDWFLGCGQEQALFANYVELLAEGLGRAPGKPAPRAWCSWYSLYSAIDETILHKVFEGLGDLPFDLLQVDDGWQVAVGDWQPNAKFPSGMAALADKIRSTGRTAGLWLAPLIAVESSRLFREHKEWFLKDVMGRYISASFNWGEHLYALDTTHPEVRGWLGGLIRQVRAWGFDYLKLDFLYAGALPGKRYEAMPREAAYRQGLRIMREAMGQDAYFLACGAPIIPSLGLCDALRAGPDVAGEWESHRDAVLLANPTTPGGRNDIRTTLHRLWLRPVVQLDPDVAYFARRGNSLTTEQKRALQDLALICGFRATSELPQWLTAKECEELRAFLKDKHKAVQTGRYAFKIGKRLVDFSDLVGLPAPATGLESLESAVMGWLADQPWALRIFDRMGKNSLEKLKKEL
jgi:alpha-galactosidase